MNNRSNKAGGPSISLELPWRTTRESSRRPRRLLIVLGVAAGVLSLSTAALWLVNGQNAAIERSRTDAMSAATEGVATLLSYDYRTIDGVVDQRQDLVTGAFEGDYAELVTNQVAPAARARKVVTRTDVVTTSVIDADADEVELLLFLNQVSASKSSKVPVLSGSRVRVQMKKVDGNWRVADVDPI